jgi:hypothetical protein
MPLNSITNIRGNFDIVSDIKDERLDFCLKAAERTLKAWVGNENYEDTSISDDMKFAEANLAAYHLLLNTGIRIRRYGLVESEADSGGSVTNNVTHKYYSIEELQKLREQYYQTALDAVEPWRVKARSSRIGTLLIPGSQ